MPIKLLLVDDHTEMRRALRSLCEEEADLQVVGEAPDGQAALRLSAELSPDVVLMDVRLPDASGLDLTARVKKQAPRAAIVLMSAHADHSSTPAALAAGAAGFMAKDMACEELAAAVRQVAAGGVYRGTSA